MSHTAAPWVIADDGTIEARFAGLVGHVIHVSEANARLIAAAPDLLAALRVVEAIWSHDQTANLDPESPLAKVRAAIKKATGENV